MYRNKSLTEYIVSFADISEHEIEGSVCFEDFPYNQLIITDKPGFAISQISNEERFAAGDVIYASESRRFGIRCEGSMRIRHIAFSGRKIKPLLHYCHLDEFRVIHMHDAESDQIVKLFDNINKQNNSDSAAKYANISTMLYEFIARLGASNLEDDEYVFGGTDLVLRQIIDYMQENYAKPVIDKDEFVRMLKMTESEVDSLFAEVFSMTAAEYFFKLRMDYAKQLLFRFSRYEIDVAARHMGYENIERFEMDFYKQFQITPREFVKLYPRNL